LRNDFIRENIEAKNDRKVGFSLLIQDKSIPMKPITNIAAKRMIATLFLAWVFTCAEGQLPVVVSGTLERIENFNSKFVTPRNVDVWLPEGYPGTGKYDVLYMHDGQMLFDSAVTWNQSAWDVDNTIANLLREKVIRNVIVVGIANGGVTRHKDYFPQKPFESLSPADRDTVSAQVQRSRRSDEVFRPVSDNYLSFLVKELKPYIDSHFKTATARNNTFIAGSSMGGLISIYAICEYPEVFGGAACISTHWPGTFAIADNPFPDAMLRYLHRKLPDPRTHRIYFDHGDKKLDELYPPLQAKVDEVMRGRGYSTSNWMTKAFPGEEHSEKAWRKRFDIPITFLLKR
jgi:enterochelin esterase-like enzyme